MAIRYSTVAQAHEVDQILALQEVNHRDHIDPASAARDGFTSVRHEHEVLKAMNLARPSVVAWSGAELAGYCLMMPREFADRVPILEPMFQLLDTLSWRGEALSSNPRWFVMGQVCVAKAYRGMGVFDGMYHHLRDTYRSAYDFVVTEISQRNPRSLRAHQRVGFERLHVYPDPSTGEVWEMVVWDWRSA